MRGTKLMEHGFHWEFLNSDGFWVECIGGQDHAEQAARNNGPGKYRRVNTTKKYEEFDV